MGQEVKNPLRTQSKYGLMGSSVKTGKKIFRGSPEHFLDKNDIWDRKPPPIHQLQSTCVGEGSRVPNLQTEFNYLDSFKSYGIFSDFLVPVVPTSSLCRPRHPHIVPIAHRRSPCGPHGCGLRCLHGLHPMLSPWTPCCPHCPHVIPVIPTSSLCCPRHLHSPQKVPMWSPWLWSLLSPWSPPHVVPMVPMLSPLSPCRPHHPHNVPIAPRRSPWLWSSLSPWSPPHVVPMVPTLSP